MKILFAGTPAFAVPVLNAIHAAGYPVCAVLTQPDRPQGRKGLLLPSPVKAAALGLQIPVLQPERLGAADLAPFGADLMVTCAYGQILRQDVLDLFPRGVWNFHASLLPRYRGAAPIARAILDGEEETGVTVMKTERGLDTGDILFARHLPILPSDTCGSLTEKLSALAADMAPAALDMIGHGAPVTPQGEGTVCRKAERTEVDFSRPAKEVSALIRGLSPAPCAFAAANGQTYNFYFAEECEGESAPAGTVLSDRKTLVVQCGEGAVRIAELQPAGGKRMSDTAFLNGRKLRRGDMFEPLSRTL